MQSDPMGWPRYKKWKIIFQKIGDDSVIPKWISEDFVKFWSENRRKSHHVLLSENILEVCIDMGFSLGVRFDTKAEIPHSFTKKRKEF